ARSPTSAARDSADRFSAGSRADACCQIVTRSSRDSCCAMPPSLPERRTSRACETASMQQAGRIGAVVLTGGTGARLGGADKASIEIGGLTLLERALDALLDVDDVVVVGEPVRTSRPVTFTREDPAGGGPAAGLLAGLRAF